MAITEIFPSLKKRLILLLLIMVLGAVVAVLAPFPNTLFILYFSLAVIAFCYTLVRLFDRRPILVLSELGVLSRMTINAQKIGLIPWADISEVRKVRSFGLFRGIELHGEMLVAERYRSKINKKDRAKNPTLLAYLTSEETVIGYDELLALVRERWAAHQGRPTASAN